MDNAMMAAEGPVSPPLAAEHRVPLAALAMPDETEQLAEPEPGDPVSYTIEGKVARVENGMAYVTPETVNGQSIAPAAPAAPAPADAYGELESLAGQMGAY